jgi:hypothetical protein
MGEYLLDTQIGLPPMPDTTNNENLSACRGQDAYVKTFFWILRRRDAEGGS